jgi:uncharacterized protein with von Willebrand factor type A (vWA) domain
VVSFRYEKRDEELLRRLSAFRDLLSLFQQLVLQANGDVEKALLYLRRMQEAGYLDRSLDLKAFAAALEKQRIVESGPKGFRTLTGKGERMIRQDALARIFTNLKKGGFGQHRTTKTGEGGERLPETRPWQYGEDPALIDFGRTLHNSLRRTGTELRIGEPDFEVSETEHLSSCATVLLVDISHSMVLYGEDRITPAKTVALAMAELIRTRFPKDSLQVCLFGDDAVEVSVDQLTRIGAGPYHTNTEAALQLAQRLLLRKKHPNRQIFMITDGKASAIREGGRLYKNPMGLDPKIVGRTLEAAAACRRNKIVVTTFMLTEDPTLVDFVNKLTRINRGRAYFASPDDLGNSVFVDYLRNRKTKLGR